jgi:hypothetical protein
MLCAKAVGSTSIVKRGFDKKSFQNTMGWRYEERSDEDVTTGIVF